MRSIQFRFSSILCILNRNRTLVMIIKEECEAHKILQYLGRNIKYQDRKMLYEHKRFQAQEFCYPFSFSLLKRRMKTPTFSYSPVCDAVVWCCALVSVCVLVKSASRKLTQCARTIFHIKCSLFILFPFSLLFLRADLSLGLLIFPTEWGWSKLEKCEPTEKRLLFISLLDSPGQEIRSVCERIK